jgi:drug/metabolite transporter (DMT)-like permease
MHDYGFRTSRRSLTPPAGGPSDGAGALAQIVYAAGFLFFDRESRRVRPAVVTGLIVFVLAIVSHLWLAGRWMQQAGFPDVPRSQPTVASTEPRAGAARQPDEVLADLGRSMPFARLR